MNSFQIINKEGKAISMKQLDEEAAKFWNKQIDDKYYANPSPEDTDVFKQQANWFDVVGWNIANQGNSCSGWANVVASMISHMNMNFINTDGDYTNKPVELAQFESSGNGYLSLPEKIEISIYCTLKWAKPYVDLINHFHSLGYTPKQIKD